MHIPDGYLSPQTTIPVLAGMVPLWSVALHKVKQKFSDKQIPTLALCAAFSFTIMMFNVPVAGGSSAHAIGAVFIAILLGPWAATVSVSTALFIQALVFGDGGILAFGVNCLNMAVVMPFVGYAVYQWISGKSSYGSKRNVVGSFIGSYVGINLAAFCAAVEFGIQPLLFKAANGTPLYCPYPLSVSIPAMMLAHGLVAGPIDGILTAAAVVYLAKAAPHLLTPEKTLRIKEPSIPFFKRYKAMLIPLGILAVLTPLGLLASGTAWGEWSGAEMKAVLGYIPKGFAAMSDKWKAMLPDYALPALGGGAAGSVTGYILSAVIGILLISGLILLTAILTKKAQKGNANRANTTQHRL